MELLLIGIGTGNPDHLTLQGVRAINAADLILIPRKGADKADLADLRRTICDRVLTNPATRIVEFDLPVRDPDEPDYLTRVEDWHDAIAAAWRDAVAAAGPAPETVALLVWGDPSLYDSTLRIAGRLGPGWTIRVVPGITAVQMLCAAHALPLNTIGGPVHITTGRQLRAGGWPEGAETVVVMLDAGGAFQVLDPTGITIWWGAFVGMAEEILIRGALADVAPQILTTRAEARARHGWIMDIYLLRRSVSA